MMRQRTTSAVILVVVAVLAFELGGLLYFIVTLR